MFYGDRDLKEVIDHTKYMLEFLKQYEDIYSFTQPELEKILKEENTVDSEDEGPEEVEKIFHKNPRESDSGLHQHDRQQETK